MYKNKLSKLHKDKYIKNVPKYVDVSHTEKYSNQLENIKLKVTLNTFLYKKI